MAQEQILTYKQIFIILLRSSSFFSLSLHLRLFVRFSIFTCVEKRHRRHLSAACASYIYKYIYVEPLETVCSADCVMKRMKFIEHGMFVTGGYDE